MLRTIARARDRSWRCPDERLDPLGERRVERVSGGCFFLFSSSEESFCWGWRESDRRPVRRRARVSSSSVRSLFGSRFERTVPAKRVGSCGMMTTASRRSCIPMVAISTSSMRICPSQGSVIPKRTEKMVDFPAPVWPTIPIFSPPLMERLRFWSARGRFER